MLKNDESKQIKAVTLYVTKKKYALIEKLAKQEDRTISNQINNLLRLDLLNKKLDDSVYIS